MNIYLTDNNIAAKGEGVYPRKTVEALFPYANKTVEELCRRHQQLLVFPHSLEDTDDKIGEATVFSLHNTDVPDEVRLTTGNLVGFFGVDDLSIKIQSRFDKGRDDYLLHYLLSQVLSFQLFDLNHNNDEEEVFDFLLFLFPHCLQSALRQGLYREYQRQECNDARVRGTINVNRFIRNDLPFAGRIAYHVRNYSEDNAMTELIRHTIEYMKTKPFGQQILHRDSDTQQYVRKIMEVTVSYDRHDRHRIIHENLRPKVHPYFTQYQPLQQLCLQILRREEIKYGEKENEICGMLFDAAWLWEEYLFKNVLCHCGFRHPQNRQRTGGIYLFEQGTDAHLPCGSRYKRYPDYFKSDCILDAKYKRLERGNVDRDDMHQIIAYMHVEQTPTGGFIYPLSTDHTQVRVDFMGTLRGHGGQVYKFGIPIPQHCDSYQDFSEKMKMIERSLQQTLTSPV